MNNVKRPGVVVTMLLLLLAGFGLNASVGRVVPRADIIFSQGDIVTMNPAQPLSKAVAVSNGKILAVGSLEQLQQYRDDNTQMVDLDGQTLMPGFIEPHTHPIASALLADWVDVSGFTHKTPEVLFQHLQEAVAQAQPGDWVLAFGLDPILTQGLQPPKREQLDTIAPHNPLFILSQVMHTAYVNSAALNASGITRDTVDPEGGHFERDNGGELTGVAHEEAVKQFKLQGDTGWWAKFKLLLTTRQDLIAQYQRYADAGYTTIGVPGPTPMFPGYLQLLEHVASRDSSPLRSYVYPLTGELEKTDYQPGYNNGRYSVLGVKIHLDGSPWTGGMATATPYLENHFTQQVIEMPKQNRGLLKHTEQSLQQQISKYHNQGWQIAVHSHGERAHDLVLDSFAKVQQQSGNNLLRHRLEHLGLITEKNLQRAAELGVTPSFFIDHIYYFGPTIKHKLLGEQRAQRFMPLAWATQYHQQVSIHTDNPATPLSPMRALRTAVTRIPQGEDNPLNTQQQMSVINALEAITIDAAWQLHAEDKIGSIEVGKQADFTLLSANPLTVAPKQWQDIQPVATWVAGEKMVNE